MALNDVKIYDVAGLTAVPTLTFLGEAAATVINAGEPCKAKVGGSKYAIPLADAEPIIGTTTAVFGIAQSTSTQTASADGSLSVYMPINGVQYSAKAKSAAAVDTEAEILALIGKRSVFDLTASVYTIDTAAADGATNGLVITGGSFLTGDVYFLIRSSGTILN